VSHSELPFASLGSSSQAALSLWIPPVAGVATALLVAGLAGYLARRQSGQAFRAWIRSGVNAGPAWTLSDSWVTNIAGAGAFLGTVANSLGISQSTVSSSAAAGVTILFIMFGGAAAVAPVVYAATAKQEAQELSQLVGSLWGFLLAGAVTLLAVMGEIATIALLVWQVSDSGAERIVLVILLSIGSILVAAYSVRALILFGSPTSEPAPPPGRKSLLGSTNTSATL
jgi:hypothetical protein